MLLGAGLLIGLAAGAAAGGWWLPVGLLVAAGFAALAVWREPAGWLGLRAAILIFLAAMVASTFAVYLFGAHAELASTALIAVITLAAAAGARVPPYGRRLLIGVLAAGAAGLVAVCVGVEPPAGRGTPVPELSGAGAALSSAAVLYGLFTVVDRDRSRRARILGIVAGGVTAAVVAAAALYQLGPVRLGLSPTSVREVLAAADAAQLTTLAHALVVLVTLPVLLLLLNAAAAAVAAVRPGPRPALFGLVGIAAALAAAALAPALLLLVASTLAVSATVLGWTRTALTARRPAAIPAPSRAASDYDDEDH